MTREEQAIEYIKGYRKLDEKLYNSAPKGTVSSITAKKCLEFWDMAIQALSQEPMQMQKITDRIEYDTDGNAYKMWMSNGKEYEQEPCTDAVSRDDRLIDLANAIESDDSGYWTNKRISSALRNISFVTQKPTECDDAISRLDKIRQIIAIPNSVIQEDVMKYKMICEVMNDDKSVS